MLINRPPKNKAKVLLETGSELSELELTGISRVRRMPINPPEDDPHHEQWISILQQLNGEASAPQMMWLTKSDIIIQNTVGTDEHKTEQDETEISQETLQAWGCF